VDIVAVLYEVAAVVADFTAAADTAAVVTGNC